MITLLHGDNIEASRNELSRLRQEYASSEIRVLEGKSLDATTLIQALESQSLFGGETMVIIENLFTKLGRKTKSIEEFATILRSKDVILWEEKELSAGTMKLLGSIQNKLFKIPVIIFQFLDNIKPGTVQHLLKLSADLFSTTVPEIVFVMIVRRVRQLMMLRDNVMPEGLQGWQAGRLTSQAKSFTMEKLVAMDKKLLDIEYSIKSGSSPFTLSQHIELFLIDL